MATWYLDYESGSNTTSSTPYGFYHMAINSGGTYQIQIGDTITGATSGVTAKVQYLVNTSGTWGAGTWAGRIYCCQASGTWTSGENLDVGANLNVATYDNATLAYAICAWRDLTAGATAARIAAGDVLCFAKTADPVRVVDEASNNLKAVFTDGSETVTLRNDGDTGNETATAKIDDCDAVGTGTNQWDKSSANVTLTANTTYYKLGSYSISMAIAAAFATDTLIAWCDLPDTTASEFGSYNGFSFWIYTSADIAANTLRLRLYSAVDGGGSVLDEYLIPYLIEGTRWYPIVYSKGSALSSTRVRSVGLYAEEDPGTVTIYIDNIFAHCGLTLRSLIGKNTSTDDYTVWPIKSISGSTITLGCVHRNTTAVDKYYTYGTTPETVAVYRTETAVCTALLATSSTAAVQTTQESAASTSYYEVIGGYNKSTGVRDGYTWFDGLNGWGHGIQVGNYFWKFSYLGFARFFRGIYSNTYPIRGLHHIYGSSIADVFFSVPGCHEDAYNLVGVAGGGDSSSQLTSFGYGNNVKDSVFYSSTSYTTSLWGSNGVFYNCKFKGGTISMFIVHACSDIVCINSKIVHTGSAKYPVSYTGYYMSAISIVFDNYNQTAGDYRAYLGYPALTNSTNPYEVKSDSSIKRGGSGTSLRLTPYHATEKAASAPIGKGVQVAVAASGNFTISCYVRKSHTSDGDSYTYDGDAPRLIVRRNDALGVTADTVIATHPGGESAGAWTQVSGSLSGVGITPSQAGVLEFYVDAAHDVDAFINIDDWAVS